MGFASKPIEIQKQELRLFWKKHYPRDLTERARISKKVCTLLTKQTEFQTAQQVALFAGLPWEIDLLSLVSKGQKNFVFPKVDPKNRSLQFKQVTVSKDLIVGALGILEPPENALSAEIQSIDLVLVPGSAFDCFGNRVGTGAGYYDRFFSSYPSLVRWGVCFHQQFHEQELAHASHDVRMDAIVTERGFHPAKKVE